MITYQEVHILVKEIRGVGARKRNVVAANGGHYERDGVGGRAERLIVPRLLEHKDADRDRRGQILDVGEEANCGAKYLEVDRQFSGLLCV